MEKQQGEQQHASSGDDRGHGGIVVAVDDR